MENEVVDRITGGSGGRKSDFRERQSWLSGRRRFNDGCGKNCPLSHLLNGDLCYANIAEDRMRTWWDFWENNTRSARNRPWMPVAGNYENEKDNGPIGYQAYQTYFALPPTGGQAEAHKGLGVGWRRN